MNPNAIPFSKAIAKAEGFGPPEALPTRCNNPGDLEVGDVGCGTDNSKTIFRTLDMGWLALQHQCDLMLSGVSHAYKLGDTMLQVADKWTGSDHAPEWAQTVCQALGISVTETLGSLATKLLK